MRIRKAIAHTLQLHEHSVIVFPLMRSPSHLELLLVALSLLSQHHVSLTHIFHLSVFHQVFQIAFLWQASHSFHRRIQLERLSRIALDSPLSNQQGRRANCVSHSSLNTNTQKAGGSDTMLIIQILCIECPDLLVLVQALDVHCLGSGASR